MQAVIKHAMVAAINAFIPSFAISDVLLGASADIPLQKSPSMQNAQIPRAHNL